MSNPALFLIFFAQLHVAVRKKKCEKRIMTKSRTVCNFDMKRLRKKVSIQFIPKPFEKTALLDPMTKKSKVKLLERMMDTKKGSVHPLAISQYRPSAEAPIRQYYHGRTNQPIHPTEWENDSDDEYDQEWIHKLGERVSSSSKIDNLNPSSLVYKFFSLS